MCAHDRETCVCLNVEERKPGRQERLRLWREVGANGELGP